MASIEIVYKCRCMAKEASVYVEERGADEGIDRFMARLQASVGDHHRANSPLCAGGVAEYVKVPFEGEIVGKGAKRH